MSEDPSCTLSGVVGRRQYLVTYSKANLEKFPTRQSFGTMLAEQFDYGSFKVKVLYWACCLEQHTTGGVHYHCSLKLSGSKKWVQVKRRISETYGIEINFSGNHNYYLSAYRYVCKEDTNVYHSIEHPPDLLLQGSPRTKICTNASVSANKRRRLHKEQQPSTSRAHSSDEKRMTPLDLSIFIRTNNIKDYDELFEVGEDRRLAGQTDIADFIFKRNESFLRELIEKSWKMNDAKKVNSDNKTSRFEKLEKFTTSECVCQGLWLECALEVLYLNEINPQVFAYHMRQSFILGRGKYRNIILIGPRDCAKSFLFKPLKKMYGDKLFENPASDKFAWVGADKAQVILLNDFRWNRNLIPWHDLLLLLEGDTVKLPAPKNRFAEDIKITSDVAIFATSRKEVKFTGTYNTTDDVETEMMAARWKPFFFKHQFAESKQKKPPPCPKCFTNLVFLEEV